MDDIQKVSEKIRKELEKVDDETLEIIYKDHSKAVQYVKIGLQNVNIEQLSNKSIEEMASEMQIVAKIELNQRSSVK